MWTSVAAGALALAVMIGAFGAHALRDRLDAYSMGVYEKAVFYHFVHALGLLIVSLMPSSPTPNQPRTTVSGSCNDRPPTHTGVLNEAKARWVCILLLAGIVLFSGSLYALAITGVRALGAITPLGGLSFIAAWLWLAYASAKRT